MKFEKTVSVARLALLLLLVCGPAGCGISLDSNSGFLGCTEENEDTVCDDGEMCHRGFCVSAACQGDDTVECYTADGPDGGQAVITGICRKGTRTCTDGVYGECRGQVLPGIETCNGLNDDCDDATDEQPAASCETGQEGECNAGMPACQGAEVVCRRTANPRAEVCDDLDNDCDGDVDEDADAPCFTAGASGCTEVTPGKFECQGLCRAGTSTCDDGTPSACVGQVIAQTGDGCTASGTAFDEDCDGEVDEDCTSCGTPGGTQPCYTGPNGTMGVGACTMGAQTCLGDGTWTACSATGPEAESCANQSTGDAMAADNDCNGTTDDIDGIDEPCVDAGNLGRCVIGASGCVDMELSCITQTAIAELCNGIDDDCEGRVDNGFDLLADEANCGACGLSCAAGLECCNGQCVNTAMDANNCGTCGSAAGDGLTCCSGDAADLNVDPQNCGACGRDCGAGRSCCNGTCVDTTRNAEHCGACDAECGAGQACCQSGCRAPGSALCEGCPTDCGTNEDCCEGACVDYQNDPTSCGSCGNQCDPGELCCNGGCVPDDEANCGACGNDCNAGDQCCSGACVPNDNLNCGGCGTVCASGQGCCGDQCVNLRTDRLNCGECGNDCDAGQNCTGGVCCGAGLTGCNGACVNTQNDEAHCGACNAVCGATCSGGNCCLLGPLLCS